MSAHDNVTIPGEPRDGDWWHLGASSIGKALSSPGLERWAIDATADAVLANLPLLESLAPTPQTAKRWITEARFAGKRPGELGASDRGTALHEYLEARLRGTPVPAPATPEVAAQLGPYVARLEEWLAAFQPEPLELEVVVLNPAHHLGGRLDFKVRIGGVVWLLDLKTAERSVDRNGRPTKPYGDTHPLQLATYAHATHVATWPVRVHEGAGGARYYLASNEELAMARAPYPVERAGLLHLTPEHCHLHPVDIGPETYAFAQHVAQGWRWLHLVSKTVVGEAVSS